MKKRIISIFFLLLLTSCFAGRSKPSNFYSMVSIDNNNLNIKLKHNIITVVEVVSIPGYLERPEIVTIKENDTELNISEFNRWAEPLSPLIKRVITDNMSKYMQNNVVRPLNVFRKKYDYSVLVYINRFDGKFNDKVYLDAWYSIVDKNGKDIVNERVNLNTNVSDNYNDLIQQMSILLAKLAESISKKLAMI